MEHAANNNNNNNNNNNTGLNLYFGYKLGLWTSTDLPLKILGPLTRHK
jgi:hypothetical protein